MTIVADPYPATDIATGLLNEWTGDDYAMLRYHPRRLTRGVYDVPSRLLIAFKDGDAHAEAVMAALAVEAVRHLAPRMRARPACHYLVVAPSHDAAKKNGPCHRLGQRLSREFDWIEYLPGLIRQMTVSKSATSAPGARPTRVEHLASMRYVGRRIHVPSESVIMLDDVITAGETSAAIRDILLEATGCHRVIGFFLARTVYT